MQQLDLSLREEQKYGQRLKSFRSAADGKKLNNKFLKKGKKKEDHP